MKIRLSAVAVVTLVSACTFIRSNAQYQEHPGTFTPTEEIVIINGPQTGADTIYDVFVRNAPQVFNIPGAPRFAIRGKENKFYLGIGGMAKATVSYDWGHPLDNPVDFIPSAIPSYIEPGNGGLTQFTAANSGLFTNFVAMPNTENELGAYFQFNLTGNNSHYGFNLMHAYIKYRGFTVGYAHGLFVDGAACPPTIDFQGPCALTQITNAVIDYVYKISPKMSIAAGIEAPMASYSADEYSKKVNQRVPDIPFYFQYGSDNKYIRVSGILRNMNYRDEVKHKNRIATGFGGKISGTAPIIESKLRVYWEVLYGKGIANYVQDIHGLGLDMIPDAKNPGKMETVKVFGGYAGLQYNFTPKIYSSITYSQDRVYPKSYSKSNPDVNGTYKWAQYFVANVFWKPNSFVTMGAEYIYGRKVDVADHGVHDNRIQAMLQVNF